MTSKPVFSKVGFTLCASGLLILSLVLSFRWLDGSRSQNEAYRELFANGNVDEGLRLLDRAVSWGPVPAQARGVRANIYAQLGVSERALEDARATVEAFEYTGSATVENARIMIQFGDVDQARVVLLKAIEKNPGNSGLISEAQDLLDQLP